MQVKAHHHENAVISASVKTLMSFVIAVVLLQCLHVVCVLSANTNFEFNVRLCHAGGCSVFYVLIP